MGIPFFSENCTNAVRQHTKSLEGLIKTLGGELSYHSETLLRQVRLHDQELSHVMVNHHLHRRGPPKFTFV